MTDPSRGMTDLPSIPTLPSVGFAAASRPRERRAPQQPSHAPSGYFPLGALAALAVATSVAEIVTDLAWLVRTRDPTFAERPAWSIAIAVLAGASFVAWMMLAQRNLDAFGWHREHGMVWSVASWLIPFANLYWPYAIVLEIWRGSAGPSDDAPEEAVVHRAPTWLAAWWALRTVGTVGLFLPIGADEVPRAWATRTAWSVAEVLSVALVVAITAAQRDRAARAPLGDAEA